MTKEQLKAKAGSNADLEVAKEAGFSISADVLKKAQSELSEGEQEGIALRIIAQSPSQNNNCVPWGNIDNKREVYTHKASALKVTFINSSITPKRRSISLERISPLPIISRLYY